MVAAPAEARDQQVGDRGPPARRSAHLVAERHEGAEGVRCLPAPPRPFEPEPVDGPVPDAEVLDVDDPGYPAAGDEDIAEVEVEVHVVVARRRALRADPGPQP